MRASGRGGALSGYCGALSSIAGSGGASETAFASMRLGSSQMTPQYCRFGRSGDEGEAQPGCETLPQGSEFIETGMIVASGAW